MNDQPPVKPKRPRKPVTRRINAQQVRRRREKEKNDSATALLKKLALAELTMDMAKSLRELTTHVTGRPERCWIATKSDCICEACIMQRAKAALAKYDAAVSNEMRSL